jgi:PAS domain-containing protein
MDQQGDQLDPKVRARFNPVMWLGQQILRRHPKCARTPRRQGIYRGFSSWADQERGRREMLRNQDVVERVFKGFLFRGEVARETIPAVLEAIDDTLQVGGALKGNQEMVRALCHAPVTGDAEGTLSGKSSKQKGIKGGSYTFETFWYIFANIIMSHDVVPYSAIERGAKIQKQQEAERIKREEEEKAFEEERIRKEEEQRQQQADYEVLYDQLVQDDTLQSIINDSKILTGDDVRPTDAGYEWEVPPKGRHVFLLAQFLQLLGFKRKEELTPDSDPFWGEEMAGHWAILQQLFKAEIADGVVEKEVLEQVIVEPAGFMGLRTMVEDELERRTEGWVNKSQDDLEEEAASLVSKKKPSMQELSQKFGMTLSRIDWLHQVFESFLDGGTCLYPDVPGYITKDQMRKLVLAVNTDLSDGEFEARFKRIDEDGSGMIEFDEFVQWTHADDVKVGGDGEAPKMTFEELAVEYNEPLSLIKYIYNCFCDILPEGESDQYPEDPASISKEEAERLVKTLAPSMKKEDFETYFGQVDVEGRGHLDFDEFLEVLDLEHLPAELRDTHSGA